MGGRAPAASVAPSVLPRDPLTNPSEPPPAVPELDIRPEPAERHPATPQGGSGKRGLVSGVLRAGDFAGETWPAISKTDAEHLAERAQESPLPAAPQRATADAGTGPPEAAAAGSEIGPAETEPGRAGPDRAPADAVGSGADLAGTGAEVTQAEVRRLPAEATEAGADAAAAQAESGATWTELVVDPETKRMFAEAQAAWAEVERASAEAMGGTSDAGAAAQAEAERGTAETTGADAGSAGVSAQNRAAAWTDEERAPAEMTGSASAPAARAEEENRAKVEEPAAEAPGVPPRSTPRPWSEELSRPREARTDALVWPPPPHRGAGAAPERPAAGAPSPPRQAGKPVWGRPTGPVRIPAAGAGTPSIGTPARPEGTPVKPPPPRVVPAAHEVPAPPRETRSGPASPVRPEPRHRTQRSAAPPVPTFTPPEGRPAAPSSPAITPPDPGHDAGPAGGGLRRLFKAMGGGHTEIDSEYEERLQRPFYGARHIVVLGCTGGAGQTVTALMMGHTFAQYCGEPVVAIDVNPGPGALARRTRSQTPETLTGLITRADQVTSLTAVRRYTSQAKSGLDVIAAGKNPVQALDDRDYALAFRTLDHFYSVTMLDAAAAIVARVLPHADQLVLVAPASSDAARAVQMTFEWLDGHGYEELRARAVTVVNGVSRRSMGDVSHAESVARGRCRALVRIPWDDHLSLDRSPRNELKSLRAPTRRAYLALAGVVAGGFSVVPDRYQEQEATR
jgi:MinD-like ATPase involved in chromosome partitioning or flagellar assembly